MKTGFGNYIAFDSPGSFDSSRGGSDNWDFELGCKPGMGKRATSVGHGSHGKMGISTMADMFGLYNQIPIGKALDTDRSFDLDGDGSSDITISGRIPDYDIHNIKSDGTTPNMSCSDCHFMFGKDDKADLTRGSITGDGVYMSDAGTFRGVNYPSTEIHAMDHQFATGNSAPDTNGMDYLDETVSCESCHTTRTHPNLKDNGGDLISPIPVHNGMPVIHLDRIGCVTCHIPELYAAPGKKKYRDWSVGFWKNNYYRNMLDWNYDLTTGSYKPTQPSHMWMKQAGEVKIYPFFPSHDPMWIDHIHDTQSLSVFDNASTMQCEGSNASCISDDDCLTAGGFDLDGNIQATSCVPADAIAITPSKVESPMMKNRVMNRAGEYMENHWSGVVGGSVGTPHNNYIRRNEGYVAPLFDGFSLADSQVIDTKADLDYMLDVAFKNIDEGENAAYLKMYQKTFDITHGVVSSEWALGGEKRGGCVSCHSSASPITATMQPNPNYSPLSYGFFEGRNQPHYYMGQQAQTDPQKGLFMGIGIGGVDYAKNWFSAFADYDCTALCDVEAATSVILAKKGYLEGVSVDHDGNINTPEITPSFDALKNADMKFFDVFSNGAVIADEGCTIASVPGGLNSMFSNNPMIGTGGYCDTDGLCSNNPSQTCDINTNFVGPMGQQNMECAIQGTIGMCTSMMGIGFDMILGWPDGTASQMGMTDGIAGLQAFVVKEGYSMGTVGCNPTGSTTDMSLLGGMAGTINKCFPNWMSNLGDTNVDDMAVAISTGMINMMSSMGIPNVPPVTTDPMIARGYLVGNGVDQPGFVNGICMNNTETTPGTCAGGFRNTGICMTNNDCSGDMDVSEEILRNPMGRINYRDDVRKAYKLDLMQSTGGLAGGVLGDESLYRLHWPMGGLANPSNPDHDADGDGVSDVVNGKISWDQAHVCIDTASLNPLNPTTTPCVNEGDLVSPVVTANQLLGYSQDQLNLLMNTSLIVGVPDEDGVYTSNYNAGMHATHDRIIQSNGDNVLSCDSCHVNTLSEGTYYMSTGSENIDPIDWNGISHDFVYTITMKPESCVKWDVQDGAYVCVESIDAQPLTGFGTCATTCHPDVSTASDDSFIRPDRVRPPRD